MRTRLLARVAGLTTVPVCVLALTGSLAGAAPATTTDAPQQPASTSVSRQLVKPAADQPPASTAGCNVPRTLANWFPLDLSRVKSDRVVSIKGVQVPFQQVKWNWDYPANPTVAQVFHSSSWLVKYAETQPQDAVAVLLQQAQMAKDPGSPTSVPASARSAHKELMRATGWTEAAVTKRMWTTMCLQSMTGDTRLIPVLESLAKANMDTRFYGPAPYGTMAWHNHGLMANEALLEAGRRLNKSAWVNMALERHDGFMLGNSKVPQSAWDSCGMVFEQSSTYQVTNVRMAARMAQNMGITDRYLSALARATSAVNALTRPDGVLEAIGDGTQAEDVEDEKFADIHEDMDVVPGGELWCPNSGWGAAHRTSGDRVQQYVVNFGPAPDGKHGHDDNGSVTWWTGRTGAAGVPVLSDRGLLGKDRDATYDWARGQKAHSTLERVGATFSGKTPGALRKEPRADRVELSTVSGNDSWNRIVTVVHDAPVLTAVDTVTSVDRSGDLVQRWQLNPVWKPASSSAVTAVTDAGNRLNVWCAVNGRLVAAKLRQVQHFPKTGVSVTAYSAECQATSARSNRIQTILGVDLTNAKASVSGSSLVVTSDQGTFRVDSAGKVTRKR